MDSEKDDRFYGAVTVSERGQIVVPVQARRELNIQMGDKLLVVKGPGGCLLLLRASVVGQMLSKWADVIDLLREEGVLKTIEVEKTMEEVDA